MMFRWTDKPAALTRAQNHLIPATMQPRRPWFTPDAYCITTKRSNNLRAERSDARKPTPTDMWFKTFQPRHHECCPSDRNGTHRTSSWPQTMRCTLLWHCPSGAVTTELLWQMRSDSRVESWLQELNGLWPLIQVEKKSYSDSWWWGEVLLMRRLTVCRKEEIWSREWVTLMFSVMSHRRWKKGVIRFNWIK